jgi:hypothetical protein
VIKFLVSLICLIARDWLVSDNLLLRDLGPNLIYIKANVCLLVCLCVSLLVCISRKSIYIVTQQYICISRKNYIYCFNRYSYLHCCTTIKTVAIRFLRNQLLILRFWSHFSLRNDFCEAILPGLYPEVLFVFEFIYTYTFYVKRLHTFHIILA